VQRIIRAYDEHKVKVAEDQMSLSLENKGANGNGKSAAPPAEREPAVEPAEE